MNTETFFEALRNIVSDYIKGQSTRILAAHMLVDALFRVGNATNSGAITRNEKNRLVVLVMQHLSLILRTEGVGAMRNFFQRSNLILNSRPTLVITGFDFSGLTLPDFSIVRTMFIACNFDEADLRGARVQVCQLQGCSFRRADLTNADFRRSVLYGCSFEDANIQNARGLP